MLNSQQKQIEFLRFAGYIGVSLNGIIVPVLIYQLTGSAAFAGFSMLIEWLPKLVLYVSGGRLAARWQPAKAHLFLEIARIAALSLLLLSSLNIASVLVISIAAATYQCANAVSNILFENLVTRWWSETTRISGHAVLVKRDVESGLIALLLGVLIHNPVVLLVMGTIIQALVVCLVFIWSKKLHACTTPVSEPIISIVSRIKHDLKYLPGTGLLPLAFLGFGVGIPAALFYSALPFYLEAASPDWSSPDIVFMFGLTRTLLSISWLNMLQRTLKHFPDKGPHLAWSAFIWMTIGCAGIVSTTPIMLLAGAFWISIAGAFYSPWARTTRQERLPEDTAARLSLTGVLIATEAMSYLAAACLLLVFNSNIISAMTCAVIIAFIAIAFAFYARILPSLRCKVA